MSSIERYIVDGPQALQPAGFNLQLPIGATFLNMLRNESVLAMWWWINPAETQMWTNTIWAIFTNENVPAAAQVHLGTINIRFDRPVERDRVVHIFGKLQP